jgi:hypothetical protein
VCGSAAHYLSRRSRTRLQPTEVGLNLLSRGFNPRQQHPRQQWFIAIYPLGVKRTKA